LSDQPTSSKPPIVRFDSVSKRFPGVVALSEVTFDVAAGSCHALCGENGAGKSTLGRILAGVHSPDEGRILLDGEPVKFAHPGDALRAGIGMVHQELAFCENLSVAENLCLGVLPARGGFVQHDEMRRQARKLLEAIGATIDVDRLVGALTVGQQQLVQIAAAVGQGAKVIVFDEPTSSLTAHEAARLHDLIRQLLARGVTAIYVSHRLDDVLELCDTVTVLRDGRHVATRPTSEIDEAALVQMMIGRKLEEYFPSHVAAARREEQLRVENLTSPTRFRDISFSVHAGEVVGFAGLVGSGRSEVAQALFGLDPEATGRVTIRGTAVHIHNPVEAMRLGLGLVPEDRKRQGLVLSLGARANVTLPILERISRLTFIRQGVEREMAQRERERLRVRTSSIDAPVAGLSGGNQQKVVLAKWLAARCSLLMLDEPTRGVDVGAKAEIHALIDALAAEGCAILLISSELPEVIGLSTRVLVLREGRLVGEVPRERATQEALMALMAGIEQEDKAKAKAKVEAR
jgi:ABC-type sugar transport system ATPase subunit